MKLKKFLETLFYPEDCIWINYRLNGCPKAIHISDIDYEYYEDEAESEQGFFFGIHAASEQGVLRDGENTYGEYNNFILEFDDISLEEQKELVKKLKMPYTSAVFSGGKSIHFIISLEEGLEYEEYLKYFNFIQELTLCDGANKDKTRYSRLPFAYRDGVEQELIDLKDKIPNQVFYDWINSREIKKIRLLNSYEKRRKQKKRATRTSDGTRDGVIELMEWYVHDYLGVNSNDDTFQVQCPVCNQDGHDRSCDNLSITLPDYNYRCWYDPEEHNRRLLAVIKKLKEPEGKLKRRRNVNSTRTRR